MRDADDPDAASIVAEAHLVPRALRSLVNITFALEFLPKFVPYEGFKHLYTWMKGLFSP